MAVEMAVHEDDESFSFCPNNDVLVDRYLRAKIDGKLGNDPTAAYFLDADVCSSRPQELVRAHSKPARVKSREAGDGQQWYFFSPVRFLGSSHKKKSRTIAGTGGKESWHVEGRPKPVDGSAAGGYVQKYSYHVRIGQEIEKPGWIMAEYSLQNTRDGDTVLCKVYKSPHGPGRTTKSGCKRKAADDLEAATPKPSTRPRKTNEEDKGDFLQFAGEVERNLLAVEYHAAAPEFGEAQNMEERLPKPQIMPANFGGDIGFEELGKRMITEEEDDEMRLALCEFFSATTIEQQDTAIQTVHGPLTDCDVIAALATGVTLDELFLDGASTSCLHPGHDPEAADGVMLFAGDTERDLLLAAYHAAAPEFANGDGPEAEDDGVMLFAGDTERDLLLAAYHAAAPEFPNGDDPEAEDGVMLFAGDADLDMLSAAYHAAPPDFPNDAMLSAAYHADLDMLSAVWEFFSAITCNRTPPSSS